MNLSSAIHRIRIEVRSGGVLSIPRAGAYLLKSYLPGAFVDVPLAGRSLTVTKNRRKLGIGGLIYARRDRFEGHLCEVFDRYAQQGTIIDVGANYGLWTTFCAVRQRPGSSIVAYEPHPDTFDVLERNTRDMSGVTLRNVGVGATSSTATFNSSLADPGSYHVDAASADPSESTIDIDLTTIDLDVADLGVEEIAMMKIDVEGYELEVLRGATETLRTLKPAVLIELVPEHLARQNATVDDVTTLLADLGYNEVPLPADVEDGNYLFEAAS